MSTLLGVSLAFGLGSALGMQSPTAPTTPQDCVKAGRDFATKRLREAGRTTAEVARQIAAERVERVRACAAAFDVEKAKESELAGMLELHTEAKQPELAERALARALASQALVPTERASLLSAAVRYLLRQPKSPERNARAERYVEMLDALPDEALEQKLQAHASLNGYYRGDDIDAGIIKHSTWLIDTGKRLGPEQRKKLGSTLIAAHVNLAEALAGQGENDRALEVLKRATADYGDLPDAARRIQNPLARYQLVGTPAAAISAPVWLNAPEGTQPLPMKGEVTLLQFTAHWCGPCKESYPGLQRLRKRFHGRGFRVVLATRLYGYFDATRDLTPEHEIARDREYFTELGLDVPIAIASAGEGDASRKVANETAYQVGGIPQLNLVDAKGKLRLIMVGYDDANEEKLAGIIEKLLGER